MQIKSITIENFQSHVRTVIEPAPAGQLTAITGQSDTGKTAVIRALRWLFYNAWNESFLRHGAKFARVTVEYEDGTKIVRERNRGGTVNVYEIARPGRDKITLSRFGNDVPLEVREITGVAPVVIASMEININVAEQGEPWFLGRPVSAPARAKVLGKLAGTEEVDVAARGVATDLLRKKQEEKKFVAEIAGLEEQIKQFDYLPAMARRIESLDQVVTKIRVTRECRQKLAEARDSLRQVDSEMAAAQVVISRWQYVELAEYTTAGAERTMTEAGSLRRAKVQLQATEEGVLQSTATIKRWSGLEAAQAVVAESSELAGRRQSLDKHKAAFESVLHNIKATDLLRARWVGVESAAELVGRAEQANERRTTVSRLSGALKQTGDSIQANDQARLRWIRVEEAGILAEKAASGRNRREKVSGLGGLLRQVEGAIILTDQARLRWSRVGESETTLQEAVGVRVRQGKVLDLSAKLRQVDVEARRAREAAVLWEQRVGDLEGAYKDELLAMGRCPLCGSNIEIQKLKEVI